MASPSSRPLSVGAIASTPKAAKRVSSRVRGYRSNALSSGHLKLTADSAKSPIPGKRPIGGSVSSALPTASETVDDSGWSATEWARSMQLHNVLMYALRLPGWMHKELPPPAVQFQYLLDLSRTDVSKLLIRAKLEGLVEHYKYITET